MQTEVLVVGKGPVGSVAALRLARAGIAVTVIDKIEQPAEDLRASTFHAPTLDMLDTLGVAEKLIAMGLRAPIYQFRDRRSGETFQLDMGEMAEFSRFPFRLQCEQYKLVAVLDELLQAESQVHARLGTELVALAQGTGGITATVRQRDGTTATIAAQYVIAADGASSAVRQIAGIGFGGFTYPEAYLCYSTQLPIEERISGLTYVNYLSDPDEWLVLLRAPSAWRVLLSVADADDTAKVLTDSFAQGVFRRLLGTDEPVAITHRTIYRIHQRVADSFVAGRICLVGDAAHLNSPIGGYGMNSGIHDAFNLTDKLATMLRGNGDASLLARYDRQRRTIANDFVQQQTIANTEALKAGWGERRALLERATMAELVADPVKRKAVLYRQSMLESLEQERAIA